MCGARGVKYSWVYLWRMGERLQPVNKGRLDSTQEWKIDKLGRKYY
jgi:hypothetical protein